MRLSVVDNGKHIQDFAIYKDKTIRIIFDRYLMHLDKTKDICDQNYRNITKVANILQKTPAECTTDGDPFKFWLITVDGQEPMHIYGSIKLNESGDAAKNFHFYCNYIATFPHPN